MSDDELDFAALKAREQEKREATKEFVVEYDDGAQAVFEYRMVDGISEIAEEHTDQRPTRSGDPEIEVTDQYAFARDVWKEGIVSAPEGFEISKRTLKDDLTDELVDDITDAIVNFSTMDEVTRRKFRGVGVRE